MSKIEALRQEIMRLCIRRSLSRRLDLSLTKRLINIISRMD